MQKWEYCVITGVSGGGGGFDGSYPKLNYFSKTGIVKIVDLGNGAASERPEGMRKVSEGGYIASTIARLGQEGWEMVGMGVETASYHCIYFRRPIE